MADKIRKPIVYVASPYTKGDPCVNTNFQIRVFNEMLDDGIVCPVIPLVSHFLHTCHPRPYRDWIEYDLDLLYGVDACVRLTAVDARMGYEVSQSSGADGEVARCRELGKPVFYSLEECYEWVREVWNKPITPTPHLIAGVDAAS